MADLKEKIKEIFGSKARTFLITKKEPSTNHIDINKSHGPILCDCHKDGKPGTCEHGLTYWGRLN